jgi:hypothetical protein
MFRPPIREWQKQIDSAVIAWRRRIHWSFEPRALAERMEGEDAPRRQPID